MTSVAYGSPDVAEIFLAHGKEFIERYPQPAHHRNLMHLIEICRTSKLGGHLQKCSQCDYSKPAYNSCRSRMCPKCQTLKKERWVEARKKDLIHCPYFHGVFTLPHDLNAIALRNKKIIYNMLFEAVSETLQKFAKKALGGSLGCISVLHTWNQKLLDHIHLHCIIPGGAINRKTLQFIQVRSEDFLFPVHALSIVFRAKFLEKFKSKRNELKIPQRLSYLEREENFADFVDSLWKKDWVVYAKRPFKGPEAVIEYLGRYTHKTAISNARILNLENGKVTFKYRDRKDGDTEKTMQLDAVEFLRRFMLHALPKGLQRIRHFGFLSNRCKAEALQIIDHLRRCADDWIEPITALSFILKAFGVDITRCPRCKQGELKAHALIFSFKPP